MNSPRGQGVGEHFFGLSSETLSEQEELRLIAFYAKAFESKWPGLSPRAVDQLAREVSGLGINGAAQQEAAIRQRLVSSRVPEEALDSEIGKVLRRICEMAESRGPSNA